MKRLFLSLVFFTFASCALYYPIYVDMGCASRIASTWNYNGTQYFYRCFKSGVGYIINNNENYVFELPTLYPDQTTVKIPLTRDNNTTQTGIIFYSQFQQNETFVILDCTQKATQKLTDLCSATCTKIAGRIYQGVFSQGGNCLDYFGFGTSPISS
ncbi:hypothetical protein ABPG74_000780 [Tetrahymena malaccensis]